MPKLSALTGPVLLTAGTLALGLSPSTAPSARGGPGIAATAQEPVRAAALVAAGLASPDTLLARGREIVRTVCAACHTEQPPPKLAPPLSHVAHRYRMSAGTSEEARTRMTAWIAAPAKDKSLMPAMAIERFGLMAPLPLPEEMRRAAATYVLSLADSAQGMQGMPRPGAMPGERRGAMRGMRHGGSTTGDTMPAHRDPSPR